MVETGFSDFRQMIGELQISVDDPHWSWLPHYVTAALRSISDATTVKATVSKVRTIVKSGKSTAQWAVKLLPLLAQVSATQARTLPFGTRLRVTNVATGQSVTVRVNDRGPFIPGRVVDVSRSAAEAIGMVDRGIAKVKLEVEK